jgi:hypothetical protein
MLSRQLKTQNMGGGTLHRHSYFGFYVLSKVYIAIQLQSLVLVLDR